MTNHLETTMKRQTFYPQVTVKSRSIKVEDADTSLMKIIWFN